jgi:thiamine-phosphate diphosphorylase/hydroxyethylthiazole kinase
VTIVQYRKKTGDTADLIREAKELHKVTKAHNVPLLINDRVDVAIAVGCEGVHIGQDDIGKKIEYLALRVFPSIVILHSI